MTTPWAVRTAGLSKRFGAVTALDSVDLLVPVGGVHALIGPNGSGKTTLLRLLLGLARPAAGTVEVLGAPVPAQLPGVIHRIGAVIEGARFHPAPTGRRLLQLQAIGLGLPATAPDRVLELVGLTEVGRRRFGGYSLGMKQRIAIAAALLTSPDLLVLDEPTNGLDPAGIHDIRTVVQRLATEGRTVLLASHLLSEVGQLAATVTVLQRGRVLQQSRMADLLGSRRSETLVRVVDLERAHHVLLTAGLPHRRGGPGEIVIEHGDPARINALLTSAGVAVLALQPLQEDLEEVFLRLTRGGGR